MLRKWSELEVSLKVADISDISTPKDHHGYYLKKLRIIYGLKIKTIAEAIYISKSILKKNEAGRQYFNRDTSFRLARYFNLNTKYFYDSYLEETDNIGDKINEYILKNNLSLKQLSKKINIDIRTLKGWINTERKPTRETYKKLKKFNII